MKPTVKFKKLAHFCGLLPAYQSSGASGCDVHASLTESINLKPGRRVLVPSGLALEIPEGYEIQVRPRSGLAIKNGITLVNTPGTIDCDYRGELKIILINLGENDFEIKNGDRIAQLILTPTIQAQFMEVDNLMGTERGAGGFGSTDLLPKKN
jgi:dUTP pyrophosphatase